LTTVLASSWSGLGLKHSVLESIPGIYVCVCVDVGMPLVDYISALKENQFFGAGFGLVGVGAFLAIARKGSQYGLSLFQRYGLTTLEITSRDKSYQWLLQWINAQGQQTQHLSVQTAFYQVRFLALVHFLHFNRSFETFVLCKAEMILLMIFTCVSYAEAHISYTNSVCPSVCLSVRHTLVLYQNG